MIKIQNAEKYYNRGKSNELHVLNNISLELPEKGMIAIFGRSGCGKTTLLNAIGGLDTLASGEITIGNESIRRDPDSLRNRQIGYIFQNYYLNKDETVFENIADALRLCGMHDEKAIEERVLAALRNVDMERYKRRTPDTLSGGQQQRVAIARAIVKSPAIVLADEPTGNLDEANTVKIMDLLKAISRERLVLLVTHEAHLVDHYCDRVIELLDGRVQSVRVNENAAGYAVRDKNDIYLGELACKKGRMPGLSIEYYGTPGEEIALKVVSVGGKLYLQSETPSLRILDATSEVHLREGVFAEEEALKEKQEKQTMLDMSHLTPFRGKHFGRLFDFKKAFVLSWRSLFSQREKKSNRFFRMCLVLIAMVLVFMSASSAVTLRDYRDLKNGSGSHDFLLPLENNPDLSALYATVGDNGVSSARLVYNYTDSWVDYWNFSIGRFSTVSTQALQAEATLRSTEDMGSEKLLAGTSTIRAADEVVITSAMADALLESSRYSHIHDYEDLLGLRMSNRIEGLSAASIVGIVESEQKCLYADKFAATAYYLTHFHGNTSKLLPASLSSTHYNGTVSEGELVLVGSENNLAGQFMAGESIQLWGQNYTVKDIVTYNYEAFVKTQYGVTLIPLEDYTQKLLDENKAEDAYQASFLWFWEHYVSYYSQYCAAYVDGDWARYIAAYYPSSLILAEVAGGSSAMYYAQMFYENTGAYPTEATRESFEAMVSEWEAEGLYVHLIDEECTRYQAEFETFLKNSGGGYLNSEMFILSDADYLLLPAMAGESDARLSFWSMDTSELAVLIHADDPETAEGVLSAAYRDLMTPEDLFERVLAESRLDLWGTLVGMAVIFVLMCLCVFFLMRTSLMRRVKEIGIYRAIGVSKRNLTFRFFVETLLLSLLTVVIGFVIAAWLVSWLMKASLLSALLYFPLWLGVLLLALILGACLIAGLLPLRLLLVKTPSAILAKYDI